MKPLFSDIFYFIFFCLILTSTPLQSQITNDIRFTTIDNTNGLPENTITSVVKDDLGFLWFGTTNGLCRYEGKNVVKIYRANQPVIEGGLENSNIRSLFLDSKKNLWIGTRLGGLTKFHEPSGSWKTYRFDKNNPQSISNDEILVITEDKKGRIWVGTENGLNVFDPKTEKFIRYLQSENPNSIKGKAVLSILIDNNERIWVGTWGGGINLLMVPENDDLTKARFRQFHLSKEPSAKNIWKIYQDRKDRYWIGSRGAGLFLMHLSEDRAKQTSDENLCPTFHQYKSDKRSHNQNISTNHMEDIYQDVKGNLWIATINGLNFISSKELNIAFKNDAQKPDLKFKVYTHNPDKSTSIPNNNVTTIFEDNQGLLWFGTYSGVSQYNWYTNQFEIFEMVDDISKTPNNQNLYVDKKGVIWFGFGDSGILNYDIKSNQQTLFKLKDGLKEGNYVHTLHSPDDEYLYIGTRKGIISLNMKTNQSKIFALPDDLNKRTGFRFIRSIFCDRQNRIWVGTLTGLYVYNQQRGTVTKYVHNQKDSTSISDDSINQIYQDSNGDIWVTSYQGLNKVIDYTPGKMKFVSFKHNPDQPETSIPSNRIISLIEVNGTLFIGSNTGISGYDLTEKTFRNYSRNTYKKSIQSMEKTADGNIWASTTEGIIFFNPHTREFNNYDQKDGLGKVLYQSGSSYHDDKGYLYFASRQGVTRFHPANLVSNAIPPPVYITDIRKMSPNGTIHETGTYASEIVMEHNEYYLSLEFAALNYNRPEKNQYAFMLEGFDDKWNYPTEKTSAVYTNLSHGTYTFKVKAANNDGLWNNSGASLKIIKRPAFWETWWFIICSVLLISGCLFFAIKIYTQNINKRNKALQEYNKILNQEIAHRKEVEATLKLRDQHMEMLVEHRTKELEEKNGEVKNLLKNIKDRNDQLEVEIAKRTKKLLDSNEDLQRSNSDLEQFAYIASHDLQEPLRVVGSFIGLLRRRYQKHFDEEAFQYIDFAVDGVQRMSEQIKNVLIFSKVSQKAINFKLTDLNEVIETKLHDLSERIDEKKVNFKIEKMPEIICEKMQIEMVFFNLISNAIKFNESKTPLITISNLSTADDGFWHFSVKDNGIGIEEKYQEKIFEIFRRLHNKSDYPGTGIGLALCQKIIHRHQGKIWVESVAGQGTTFHFTVSKQLNPVEKIQTEKMLKA